MITPEVAITTATPENRNAGRERRFKGGIWAGPRSFPEPDFRIGSSTSPRQPLFPGSKANTAALSPDRHSAVIYTCRVTNDSVPPSETSELSDIERLFKEAIQHGGFDYIYTLIRVDGMACPPAYRDEFIVLRDHLERPDSANSSADDVLASAPGPLKLLQNLLNCAQSGHYDIEPFRTLRTGAFPNTVWPTVRQQAEYVVASARTAGFPVLSSQVAAGYLGALTPEQRFSGNGSTLVSLLKELTTCYFGKLSKFNTEPKYCKILGSLDVAEFLTDPEIGLIGLRIHFSENCTAEFSRTRDGAFPMNLDFGPPVTFLKMTAEPSSNEYRVNGKRLYEVGLPGRYNALGEWKPMIYPGDAHHLVQECLQLSDDADVQGAMLYMRLTGHKCIEFAVRSNLELPGTYTATEEGNLHIWKCPAIETDFPANVCTYDCWIELATGDLTEVVDRLASISWFVAMLFFPFGATHSWRNKYRMTVGATGVLVPSHDDLKTVDAILKTFPNTPEGFVLGRGIDWYNMGNASSNPFTRFLCYYIAFESVAVAIAEGAALGEESLVKPSKPERRDATIACIIQKHEELFEHDPRRFVEQAYFDCIVGLKQKAKRAAAVVFGENHPHLTLLFEKSPSGEISLAELRSDLAHGGMTLLQKMDRDLVRKNVHRMGEVAKEFLLRVLFRLKPVDPAPSWSGKARVGLGVADPRSTMWSTTDSAFPKPTNWKIRPEWCE